MSLEEDDKDKIIMALCRGIYAQEENKRLRKYIKRMMGEKNKQRGAKKGTMKKKPQQGEKSKGVKIPNTDNDLESWNELTEGDFDSQLEDIIDSLEESEEGEEDG